MSQVVRRWWLLATTLLAIASVAALALLASAEIIPSVVRDPLLGFVHPGTTVWWLVLGGPFRSAPSSPTGIAFAATANTALWLLVLWLAVVIGRAIRRMLAATRS
jgi:hypothetical protein